MGLTEAMPVTQLFRLMPLGSIRSINAVHAGDLARLKAALAGVRASCPIRYAPIILARQRGGRTAIHTCGLTLALELLEGLICSIVNDVAATCPRAEVWKRRGTVSRLTACRCITKTIF